MKTFLIFLCSVAFRMTPLRAVTAKVPGKAPEPPCCREGLPPGKRSLPRAGSSRAHARLFRHSRAGALLGQANWIVPGHPERRRLFQVVTLADFEPGAMPPTGHAISKAEVAGYSAARTS